MINIPRAATSSALFLVAAVLLGSCGIARAETPFNENYINTWGSDHFNLSNQGTEVELTMDESSGSGFESKRSYGSGFFHIRIKVPKKNCAGVVTAFYLSSNGEPHDELDFEILGNEESRPIKLNTNIFIDGIGGREKTVHLNWFDPTADFHNYSLLWNHHQIVFFVDGVPIRVMKKEEGKSYPNTRAMRVMASVWNGHFWAMDPDQKDINWADGPFRAYFKSFYINGCPVNEGSDDVVAVCSAPEYWWNAEKYWTLNEEQQKAFEYVLAHHQTEDYCTYRPHPPECGL